MNDKTNRRLDVDGNDKLTGVVMVVEVVVARGAT